MGLSDDPQDGFRQTLPFDMLCPTSQRFHFAAKHIEENLTGCRQLQSTYFADAVNDRARRELTDKTKSGFGEGRGCQVAC
jgi:hypothetical protein